MYVDSMGNIYVADYLRLMKFPAGSTSATNGISMISGLGITSSPSGIYVSQGNMYVADASEWIVKYRDTITTLSAGVIVAGSNQGTGANQLDRPQDVVIDAFGNKYVADGNNFRVQKFPAGSTYGTNAVTVAGGNGNGIALNQLGSILRIALDAAGDLYVSDGVNARVLRFPPGSTSATQGTIVAGGVVNASGTAANQLLSNKGMAFDKRGSLLVADMFGDDVRRFPPGSVGGTNWTRVAGNGTQGSGANQLYFPQAVSLDKFGNIYVLDQSNYRVQKFSATTLAFKPTAAGTYTATVTTSGCTSPMSDSVVIHAAPATAVSVSAQTTVCKYSIDTFTAVPVNAGSAPVYHWYKNGVAVGANSSIYINSSLNNNDSIMVTMTSSMPCAIPVIASSSWMHITVYPVYHDSITHNICNNSSVTIEGNTYNTTGYYTFTHTTVNGCDSLVTHHVIVRPLSHDTISRSLCTAGSYTLGSHTYSTPGTYTDTLHTAGGCDSIVVLRLIQSSVPTPGVLTTSGSGCAGYDSLSLSGAANANGVSWYRNDTLVHIDTTRDFFTGATVAGGNMMGTALNQLSLVQGVAVDAAGNVYAADNNNRVLKFPPGSNTTTFGTVVAGGNGSGSGLNQITPTSLALDHSGNMYVNDFVNNRVLKFPPGSTGSTSGTVVVNGNINLFQNLYRIVSYYTWVDGAGQIYVADVGSERIVKFPANSNNSTIGVTIAGGNGQGTGANQFHQPMGMYVDAGGYLYVSDYLNDRVQRFPPGSTSASSGVTVAGGNGTGSAANQFNHPTSVWVDSAGYLYVSDVYNNRVLKFPPGSTSANYGTVVAGSGGLGYGPKNLHSPSQIYMDSLHSLYVADFNNHRILKASLGVRSVYTPTASGQYTAVYTSAGGCVSAISDTVYIQAATAASMTITASDTAIYSGDLINFHATPVNGGATPYYQWYKNGVATVGGTSFADYSTNFLSDHDSIWCTIYQNASCVLPNLIKSNVIHIHVDTSVGQCFCQHFGQLSGAVRIRLSIHSSLRRSMAGYHLFIRFTKMEYIKRVPHPLDTFSTT